MWNMLSLSARLCLLALLAVGCENRTTPEPAVADVAVRSDPSPPVDSSTTLAPAPRVPVEPTAAPIVIDGSSTVFPITEAVAAVFEEQVPGVPVRLGVSGTGGGFKKFCRKETDVSDASRPIKDSEKELCRENGVELVELPVAFDGISVVVHGDNEWCRCLTVEELKALWSPGAEEHFQHWSRLRASWPEKKIELFAPGRDSGTFDYFTRAIVGREGTSRDDFRASEDDYLLAQGVAREPFALGFFGYAYYNEYRDRLRPVAVDHGAGCVLPSEQTIADGSYRPLSRPIFIYVRKDSLDRPEVRRFVELYLEQAREIVPGVGYVPLPERAYELALRRLREMRLGSVFDGGSQVGVSIEELLAIEAEG